MCENMTNVSSSNIKSVGYDMDKKILCIKFLNGSLYTYKDVPLSKYEALRDANSVGKYLNQNIKGIYSYTQIF